MRISAAAKLRSDCNNPIRSRFADLAYHSKDFSCTNICRVSATCSGFTVPRGTQKNRPCLLEFGTVILILLL